MHPIPTRARPEDRFAHVAISFGAALHVAYLRHERVQSTRLKSEEVNNETENINKMPASIERRRESYALGFKSGEFGSPSQTAQLGGRGRRQGGLPAGLDRTR